MSVGTAFYPREQELNQHLAWGEWSGYHSAAVYADFHDIEYNAIREAAAVVDVSPLYKYVVRGRDAGRLLDRVMTRDISKLQVDRVYYTPWCDEDGKVIDDGTVTRLTEDSYRITAADPTERWLTMNATQLDVEIVTSARRRRASRSKGASRARCSRTRRARTGPTSATSAGASPRSREPRWT